MKCELDFARRMLLKCNESLQIEISDYKSELTKLKGLVQLLLEEEKAQKLFEHKLAKELAVAKQQHQFEKIQHDKVQLSLESSCDELDQLNIDFRTIEQVLF